MFHNLCEWIARRPLPARLIGGVDVELFCMRADDGKRRVVTLVNNGFNRFDALTLELDGLPREHAAAARTVTAHGAIEPLSLTMERLSDRWRVMLPRDVLPGPFEVRVLSFE
jgi:hypothetical protein